MNAIAITRLSFAFAKASTSSRKVYELHPGDELPIDDPDELFDFYRATVDNQAVYILKEGARVIRRQADQAPSLARIVDVAAQKLTELSKKYAWKQFADEVGGEFIEEAGTLMALGPLKVGESQRVVTTVRQGTIRLDTRYTSVHGYSVPLTYMTSSVRTRDGFHFEIFRRVGVFSQLLRRFFKSHDIGVGDRDFDRAFVVLSNSESKVRALCGNPHFRSLAEAIGKGKLRFRKKELRFEDEGEITDVGRLRSLHQLFIETLNELDQMRSIVGEAPADL